MIKLTFSQLAKVLEIKDQLLCDGSFYGVSVDTRSLEKGNLFIGLTGDNGCDGADYLDEAISKGASAAIINKRKNNINEKIAKNIPYYTVDNTYNAMNKLAIYWRNQFKLPIIAVTGSNGKTTIKNMIGAILSKACHGKQNQVLSTHGNFNNHIGVPLNLFRLNKEHRYMVLEMGMNHFGEIARLSNMVRPNIAIISNAFPCHLDGVGDLDGVAQAKAEIFQGLQSNQKQLSYAILNADDQYYNYWKNNTKNHRNISFSLEKLSDVYACNLKIMTNCSQFDLHAFDNKIAIKLSLPGKHNIINSLAAAAACLAARIDLLAIKQGLESLASIDKRLEVVKIKNGTWILNDCYNANPASLRAAIDVLVTYPGQKILVLGDMKELGKHEAKLHAEMGEYAKQAGVDVILAFGELTKNTTAAFGKNAQHFANKPALIKYLQTLLAKNITILVKGSRSMKMEEIVNKITRQS